MRPLLTKNVEPKKQSAPNLFAKNPSTTSKQTHCPKSRVLNPRSFSSSLQRVKYMVPDPNPPKATSCVADKLIYSAAPDHLTSG
jgi:hypothetical protein